MGYGGPRSPQQATRDVKPPGPRGRHAPAPEAKVWPHLGPKDEGKFALIDIKSGDYELDRDEVAASDRLLARRPDAQVWMLPGRYSLCPPLWITLQDDSSCGWRAMDAKLTLKLDKETIEQAKRYAERRGLSLSRIVESYFLRLAQSEEPPREKLTGVVAELAGVLKGAEIG